jgi:hypothetical protein
MRNRSNLFTVTEIELARVCTNAPGEYSLTEPELRACRAVIGWADEKSPIHRDDIALATRLFDVLKRGWVR